MLGVSHDIIEDTEITIESLKNEIDADMEFWEALDKISKRDGETDDDNIQRVVTSVLATKVKIQDLKHNSWADRLPHVKGGHATLFNKYRIYLGYLSDALYRYERGSFIITLEGWKIQESEDV